MTPIMRPKPHNPSINVCYIYVDVVAISLVYVAFPYVYLLSNYMNNVQLNNENLNKYMHNTKKPHHNFEYCHAFLISI